MVGTRSKAPAGPSKMMPQVRKINVVRPKQGNLVKSCTQRKTRRNMEMGEKNVEEEENVEPVSTRKMINPRRIRELGKKKDVKVEANVEPESTRKSIAPRRMREMGKKEDVKVEANVEPESTRKTIAPRKMREIGKKNVEEEENVEPVLTRKTIAPRRIREMGKKKDVKEEENVEPESTRKTIAPRRMREMEKKDDVKEEENVEPKPMRKTIAPQRMIGCVSSHGQDLPMPINVVSGNLHQPSHEAITTKRIEDAHTSSPLVPFQISPSKAGTCEDVEPSRKTCTVPLELSPCPCPSPPPISLKVKRSYSRLSEPSVMGHSPLPSCSGESQTPTRNSSSVQHDSLFGFANLLSSEELASISPVHSREECSFPAVGSFVLPCSPGTEDCFPIPGVELDKKKKKKRIARQLDVLEIHDMMTKLNKEFCDAEEFQLIVE